MRVSVSWRSRLSRSSSSATWAARASSSVSSSSRPASARWRRPAALIRGARRKASARASRSPGSSVRDLHQRPKARPPGARHRLEPLAHQPAVLAAERHEVGHGGERDDVDVLGSRGRILARAYVERLGELVGHSRGAQVRERVAADRGVHDRACGQPLAGTVVVCDHHVEAELERPVHLCRRGDAAVHGHEQPGALGGQPLHGGRREAVALLHAARKVPRHARAQAPQRPHENRGGRDAVDVVVAVHDDRRAALDVARGSPRRPRGCRRAGTDRGARRPRGSAAPPRATRGRAARGSTRPWATAPARARSRQRPSTNTAQQTSAQRRRA